MLAQNLSCKAYCLVRADRAVCGNIQCKLIVVSLLSDTRILNCDVDSLYRCVDRIYRDNTDLSIRCLVLVRADVASALCDRKLDEQFSVLSAECSDHKVRIHDLNVLVNLNIRSADNALALILDISILGLVRLAAVLDSKTFDIHDDLSNIFLDSGNSSELMLYSVNLDLAYSCTGKRRKHDPSEGISKSDAIASLKGFHYKSAILLIIGDLHDLDARSLKIKHANTSFARLIVNI